MQYPVLPQLRTKAPAETVRVHEVGEGLRPVHLDHRDALAIRALELGIAVDCDLDELKRDLLPDGREHALGALAEMAAVSEVDGDLVHRLR